MPASSSVADKYRFRVSQELKLAILNGSDLLKQILQDQFWPKQEELNEEIGFSEDPLEERDPEIYPANGIIHKYPNKILVLTTDQCPVYCRFCTRKRRTLMASTEVAASSAGVVAYCLDHPEVNEVIFSGGDPLMLPNSAFQEYIYSAAQLPQIQFLRIHSKAISTLPRRFSPEFWQLIQDFSHDFPQKILSFVFHINHPLEISAKVEDIYQRFHEFKVPVFNQAVLLKGINDDAQILRELALKLHKNRVGFYYLHQLDKIIGAKHFEVPKQQGLALMQQLRLLIPPYLMPRYVEDSRYGKINLFY